MENQKTQTSSSSQTAEVKKEVHLAPFTNIRPNSQKSDGMAVANPGQTAVDPTFLAGMGQIPAPDGTYVNPYQLTQMFPAGFTPQLPRMARSQGQRNRFDLSNRLSIDQPKKKASEPQKGKKTEDPKQTTSAKGKEKIATASQSEEEKTPSQSKQQPTATSQEKTEFDKDLLISGRQFRFDRVMLDEFKTGFKALHPVRQVQQVLLDNLYYANKRKNVRWHVAALNALVTYFQSTQAECYYVDEGQYAGVYFAEYEILEKPGEIKYYPCDNVFEAVERVRSKNAEFIMSGKLYYRAHMPTQVADYFEEREIIYKKTIKSMIEFMDAQEKVQDGTTVSKVPAVEKILRLMERELTKVVPKKHEERALDTILRQAVVVPDSEESRKDESSDNVVFEKEQDACSPREKKRPRLLL